MVTGMVVTLALSRNFGEEEQKNASRLAGGWRCSAYSPEGLLLLFTSIKGLPANDKACVTIIYGADLLH